jgi:hypothetical protein
MPIGGDVKRAILRAGVDELIRHAIPVSGKRMSPVYSAQ